MKDVTQYPWLHMRGSTYYLRAPVPREIQKDYGHKEVWKSLRTKDKSEAIKRLRELTPSILKQFERFQFADGQPLGPIVYELTQDQLKHIEESYFVSFLDQDDQMRESGFEGVDYDNRIEWHETFESVAREEFARGQKSEFYMDEATDILSWDNVQINLAHDSPSWPKLIRAIYAATIRAYAVLKERNSGDVIPTPEMPELKRVVKRGPTLEDAVSFYIAEKVAGDEYSRKKTTDRINRMMKTVKEALGEVPPLADWTVDHAYAARDYLLNKGTLKPSSVRRELNVLRGIFSCYKSKKLRSLDNPFEGLELPANAVVDKDARAPLTDELITKIRERLEAHSNRDLQLMWRLLVGTGCRLAEVAGLRVEDVVTSGEFPHLKLVAHEKRRLKNASSAREVPLVADAFDAAKEAVESADHGEALFSRYFGAGGPDRASAALMKHVRALTNDKLLTVHSLRHSFADRCDLAGIGTMEKSAILGHHNASTTEKHYGSKRARLAVLSKAMKAAFEV